MTRQWGGHLAIERGSTDRLGLDDRERQQYKVQISQSVADAVLLLDYKLPQGSGLDVAERIRSNGCCSNRSNLGV
jgi:CheY-like chemotaxis protein